MTNKYGSSGSKVNDSKGLLYSKDFIPSIYRERQPEKMEEKQSTYQSAKQTDIYKKYKIADDKLMDEKPSAAAVVPKKVQEPVKERSVSPLPEGKYKLLQDSDSDEDEEVILRLFSWLKLLRNIERNDLDMYKLYLFINVDQS